MLLSSVLSLAVALPAAAQGRFTRGLAGAYLAARSANGASDYSAAAEYFTRALSRDNRNPMLLENAMLAQLALGDVARAVPVAKRLDDTELDSQVANMVIVADLAAAADYPALIALLDEGRSVGPLVDALLKAWSLVGQDDMEGAIAAFDTASQSTGLQAFALYHKALSLAVTGDYEGAQAVFGGEDGNTLRLTRRGGIAHAQVLSQLDRNADAVELIDKGFGRQLDPGLEALRAALVAGEKVEFDLIGSVTDGMAEVFFTVAGALNGEAANSYTLLYSRVAEYLRPDHVDALLLSAGLLEQLQQYDLATQAYDKVPESDPSFHLAELGRAATMQASGDPEDAVTVLRALAESHPELGIVHTTLGDTLRRLERYGEAIEAYDAALALADPDDARQWVVYYARAICHEREKQWDQAEPDFRTALELNPGQPQVLNYLGYSFLEMNTNLDEAMTMIREAVAARPDSGHIVDSLGWGLYRLGEYSEAVEHMEKASELLPVDPIVNDHLGDVYWAVGRNIEAQFQWNRALSFEPSEEEAARIRRKLEVGLDQVLEEEGAPPLEMVRDDG